MPSSPVALIVRDIYEDLVALQLEFDEVDWSFKAGTLSAVTEPIVLEEIDLGPFEIVLDGRQIDTATPNHVIAKRENPAECDSGGAGVGGTRCSFSSSSPGK